MLRLSQPVLVRAGQVAVVLAFLGAWELAARWELVDRRLLPGPATVASVMWAMLSEASVRRDLLATLTAVVVAMAFAMPLAIVAGMAIADTAVGKRLAPIADLGVAVPQSIFLPIFLLIFGTGLLEKIVFGFTHAIFVIALSAAAATRSVPRSFVQMAGLYGAKRAQLYAKVYLPCMAPVILQGVRIGLIFCVAGVVLAEMYVSRVGIGHEIVFWGTSFAIPQLLAAIFLVGIVTVACNQALHVVERRMSRWRPA